MFYSVSLLLLVGVCTTRFAAGQAAPDHQHQILVIKEASQDAGVDLEDIDIEERTLVGIMDRAKSIVTKSRLITTLENVIDTAQALVDRVKLYEGVKLGGKFDVFVRPIYTKSNDSHSTPDLGAEGNPRHSGQSARPTIPAGSPHL